MKRPFPLVLACLLCFGAAAQAQNYRITSEPYAPGEDTQVPADPRVLPQTPVLAQAPPAPAAARAASALADAKIVLCCPADAVVTLDGNKTTSTGTCRTYVTSGVGTFDLCVTTSDGWTCSKKVAVKDGETTQVSCCGCPCAVKGVRGFLGDTPCGSGGCSNCTTSCPAGCPSGQCYGQQATYGNFPQMFQGFQGGGCANGQCGGGSSGFRGRR